MVNFCPVPINDNTRPYIALGVITALLLVIGMSCFSTYTLIQETDRIAAQANASLRADPDDPFLLDEYNAAAADYIGATAYFPGNVVGRATGYQPDKWAIIKTHHVTPWGISPYFPAGNINL